MIYLWLKKTGCLQKAAIRLKTAQSVWVAFLVRFIYIYISKNIPKICLTNLRHQGEAMLFYFEGSCDNRLQSIAVLMPSFLFFFFKNNKQSGCGKRRV